MSPEIANDSVALAASVAGFAFLTLLRFQLLWPRRLSRQGWLMRRCIRPCFRAARRSLVADSLSAAIVMLVFGSATLCVLEYLRNPSFHEQFHKTRNAFPALASALRTAEGQAAGLQTVLIALAALLVGFLIASFAVVPLRPRYRLFSALREMCRPRSPHSAHRLDAEEHPHERWLARALAFCSNRDTLVTAMVDARVAHERLEDVWYDDLFLLSVVRGQAQTPALEISQLATARNAFLTLLEERQRVLIQYSRVEKVVGTSGARFAILALAVLASLAAASAAIHLVLGSYLGK